MTSGLTFRRNKPTVASGEWAASGLSTPPWQRKMEPTARIALASPVYETESLLLTYAGPFASPAFLQARSVESEAGAAPAHGGFADRRVC